MWYVGPGVHPCLSPDLNHVTIHNISYMDGIGNAKVSESEVFNYMTLPDAVSPSAELKNLSHEGFFNREMSRKLENSRRYTRLAGFKSP